MKGKTVIANMREDADTVMIKWAERNGVFVRIDRKTPFGNPFKNGSRDQVIAEYAAYLDELVNEICGGCCGGSMPQTLVAITSIKAGSVLGCWCYPLPCHGEVKAKIVNDHYCKFTPIAMLVRKPQQLSLF